jgi:murein DD-endopeptidase MepM/ murein hydrolase activator NlpD
VLRRLLSRSGTAGVAAVMLLPGCGQYGGVHRSLATASPSASGASPASGTALATGPNGENQGLCLSPTPSPGSTGATPSPPPGCTVVGFVKVVTITRVRQRVPKGAKPEAIRVAGRRTTDPLLICPVHGQGYYSDDFGAPRFAGGFHLHAGNDIFAALGTPIVAPFDGRAVATSNSLGGLAVNVYGAHGYAYNAHLASYGTLGEVKAGTVIGFVGNTGDAAGGPYHDHFEWHPKPLPPPPLHVSPYGVSMVGSATDPAIDPFPFLQGVCR